MMIEQVHISVCQLLAVHVLDFVAEHTPVEADEARLGEFADEGGDILALNIGIGVVLAASSGIGCIAIVDEEIELVLHFAVLVVVLAIKDVSLSHFIVMLGHEGGLNLVLDLLHGDAVVDFQAPHHIDKHILRCEAVHREECP